MARWLILLLLSTPCLAQPFTTFQPRTTQDGAQIWIFTSQWTPKVLAGLGDPEVWLLDAIGKSMAKHQFCPHGWQITSRNEMGGTLVIEGKCVSDSVRPQGE